MLIRSVFFCKSSGIGRRHPDLCFCIQNSVKTTFIADSYVYGHALHNCFCGVNDIIIITIIIIVIQLFYLQWRLFHLGQFHRGGRRSSYAKSSMLHAHNKTFASGVQRVPSVVFINFPSIQFHPYIWIQNNA